MLVHDRSAIELSPTGEAAVPFWRRAFGDFVLVDTEIIPCDPFLDRELFKKASRSRENELAGSTHQGGRQ